MATCEVTGQLTKHEVNAVYGNELHTFLGLDQANSPHPCGDIGEAKSLGVVKVDGVKAHLFGFCGMYGAPSCTSKAAQLTLIWEKKGIAFITQSQGETRAALINFSRTLRSV
ncbi:MAG: hypothetical protein ABJB47_14950 [Actinomycetota bacterium]